MRSGTDTALHTRSGLIFRLSAMIVSTITGTACRAVLAEVPASTAEANHPWVASGSIWFFQNRTELDGTELAKLVETAAWVRLHAGAEVGINFPVGRSDSGADHARISQSRIEVVHAALIQAGVPSSQIRVGVFDGNISSLDRRVVLFVRASRPPWPETAGTRLESLR